MKSFNVSRLPPMITLGYAGENNWRPNRFDCSSLLTNHPNGVVTLWLLPEGETQAYPVALDRDGNTVVWTPLSEEMSAATGAFQLVCIDGTDVGKSEVVMFRVGESIVPGAEHPAEVPSWAAETIRRSEDAAQRAEEAAESIDIEALEARIAQAVEDYLEEHPMAVDDALSSTSENPVQNKVINAALQSKQDAPLEIHVTESGGTYSTTATAEQIRAAKENSVFVVDGEARIKALLWFPLDEGVDLLIGMQTLNSTIMSVAATVSTDRVSIAVEQTPVPVLATDPDMEDWDSGKTVDAAVLKTALEMFAAVLTDIYGVIDEKADKTEIPAAVTEQDVAEWGFTKNTGDYTKPSTGIPKSDLAQAVQTSLGKADTALQQHQSLSDYQTKAITDTGNYFTADTVEGALQEIGAELSGINTLIGSGVIS